MLFDLKPKEKAKDFFNYKDELSTLIKYLRDSTTRIIVIRGLRRTGKSSLLRVALNKTGSKYILIDSRELSSLSRRAFESRLFEKLRGLRGISTKILERIESVEVGMRISVKSRENLWDLLKKIKPIIAIDEAQMLIGSGVDAFLAAAFDNTECKIVLTGSEVGVMESFLGKGNPKAPLFGRAYAEVKTYPLSYEKSKEFLRAGFKEAGKKINEEEIEEAVRQLDGIIGWLTLFGNLSLLTNPTQALKRAEEEGKSLAYSELQSFLEKRVQAKGRYLALLRVLAQKDASWSVLKRLVERELDEEISDAQFTDYLRGLMNYGFIVEKEKLYTIPDPLLKKALITDGYRARFGR